MYHYVAQSNPNMAKALCHKYGYKIQGVRSEADLGVLLQQLVEKEGETALKDIVDNHPDKGLIVEMYENEKSSPDLRNIAPAFPPAPAYMPGYHNFTGHEIAEREYSRRQSNDNSVYMLASAFLLGVAILAVKM